MNPPNPSDGSRALSRSGGRLGMKRFGKKLRAGDQLIAPTSAQRSTFRVKILSNNATVPASLLMRPSQSRPSNSRQPSASRRYRSLIIWRLEERLTCPNEMPALRVGKFGLLVHRIQPHDAASTSYKTRLLFVSGRIDAGTLVGCSRSLQLEIPVDGTRLFVKIEEWKSMLCISCCGDGRVERVDTEYLLEQGSVEKLKLKRIVCCLSQDLTLPSLVWVD